MPLGEAGEVLLGELAEQVPPLAVPLLDHGDVALEALLAPVLEQREEHHLAQSADMQRRGLLVELNPLDERSGAGGPPDPETRGDDLGEGVEAHHAPIHVHREERLQRLIVLLLVELEVEVGVVLEDDEVVLLRDAVDLPTPLLGQCGPRRVLSRGDHVQHLGLGAVDGPRVEERAEVGRREARVVGLHTHQPAPERPQPRQRPTVGGVLDEDVVVGVDEHLEGLGVGVRRPVRHAHVPVLPRSVGWVVLARLVVFEPLHELRDTVRGGVLEGGVHVDALDGEGGAVRQVHVHPLDGEERRVGHATTQRDHAGQLKEGLEGADGGGLTSLGRHAQERLVVRDAGGSARCQRSLHGE